MYPKIIRDWPDCIECIILEIFGIDILTSWSRYDNAQENNNKIYLFGTCVGAQPITLSEYVSICSG